MHSVVSWQMWCEATSFPCRAYDFDPNREAQAFQQAAPVAQKEVDAPKAPQRVSRCPAAYLLGI